MAEETLTEALEKLDDENIQSAALPESRRVEEETSEEVAIIDLDEDDVKDIEPITEDVVKKSLNLNQSLMKKSFLKLKRGQEKLKTESIRQ